MPTDIKKRVETSRSSSWPFIYSVDVQTALIFFFTVILSLLAPFPDTADEIEGLNFIHEAIYEQLDQFKVNISKEQLWFLCIFF
mgnify:CR=1 FL=1